MDDDTLDKFIANMRAAGQPDEMIAENLLSAGHSEIMVLNALGVEHLSQLSGEDDTDDVVPAVSPVEHAPSAYTVVDAEGNPIVSQDNLPKAVGATPSAAPAPKKPAPNRVQRPSRHYPRPPARKISTMKSQPKPTQFVRPSEGLAAPKVSGFIHPSKTGVPQATPKKHEVTPPPPKKPPIMPNEKSEPKPEPKPKHKIEPQQEIHAINYGHHTFDDFMGRIEAHRELAASHDAVLASGEHSASEQVEQGHEPISAHHDKVETSPKPAPVVETKKKKPTPKGPGDINELLSEQKEEAAAGQGGPDMGDLLNEKDIEELTNHPDIAPPSKAAAVDLKKIPQTPEIARVGGVASDIRNSLALKIVVILIGALALIGLAASVISSISG